MPALRADENGWQVEKSRHFLVYHRGSKTFAETVSREAERLYASIVKDLGLSRRDNFWLWDDRARIMIYASRTRFRSAENAPEWAAGKARYADRTISTYQKSDGFIKTTLPHELAHLIFRDFVGFKGDVPLWLDEGVAQWCESAGRAKRLKVARALAAGKQAMGLSLLTKVAAADLGDSRRAGVFYAQAVSIVDFLVTQFGADKFRKFCGSLRDGKSLDDALRFTYPTKIRNIEELEREWIRAMGTGE